jgi:hypothetical protein
MIALLTVLHLTHFKGSSYDFPKGSESKFNVKIQFDGFIPLFGGKIGKADVDMVVRALGVEPKQADMQSVDSEIVELKAVAFGSSLPLNKNNIGQFFPRAIATFDSSGDVKLNDAPEINMPVKLPGLDSKRLPEISYVPLTIDRQAAAGGTPFEFSRKFNGAVMKYKVTPSPQDEFKQEFTIEVSQDSNSFEDAYGNPIVEAMAKTKVKTVLTGKGSATFNMEKRMFDKVIVETNADSDVTIIKTGKTSKRSLKTTLTIVRDGVKLDK